MEREPVGESGARQPAPDRLEGIRMPHAKFGPDPLITMGEVNIPHSEKTRDLNLVAVEIKLVDRHAITLTISRGVQRIMAVALRVVDQRT